MERNDIIYVLRKVRKVLKTMGAEGGRSMVFGIWLGLFKVGSQSEHKFIFFLPQFYRRKPF